MTDSRSREKSLHELEFNDLNIHLYLTLNYGTASEHLDFDFMVLYNAFVLSRGLTITQNTICTRAAQLIEFLIAITIMDATIT